MLRLAKGNSLVVPLMIGLFLANDPITVGTNSAFFRRRLWQESDVLPIRDAEAAEPDLYIFASCLLRTWPFLFDQAPEDLAHSVEKTNEGSRTEGATLSRPSPPCHNGIG